MKHNNRFTNEQATLRKQLADTLRYLRRFGGYYLSRQDVEVPVGCITTGHSGVNLGNLVDYVDPSDYSSVFVRGSAEEDYDGYKEGYIEIYTCRKQTDEEYFDSVCEYLLPVDYQQKQYQEYLRLKNIFEKEGV